MRLNGHVIPEVWSLSYLQIRSSFLLCLFMPKLVRNYIEVPQIYHCFYGSHEIRRLSFNLGDVIRIGKLYYSHMSKKIIFSCLGLQLKIILIID